MIAGVAAGFAVVSVCFGVLIVAGVWVVIKVATGNDYEEEAK